MDAKTPINNEVCRGTLVDAHEPTLHSHASRHAKGSHPSPQDMTAKHVTQKMLTSAPAHIPTDVSAVACWEACRQDAGTGGEGGGATKKGAPHR